MRTEIRKMEECYEHGRFVDRYRIATLVKLPRVQQEHEEKTRKRAKRIGEE